VNEEAALTSGAAYKRRRLEELKKAKEGTRSAIDDWLDYLGFDTDAVVVVEGNRNNLTRDLQGSGATISEQMRDADILKRQKEKQEEGAVEAGSWSSYIYGGWRMLHKFTGSIDPMTRAEAESLFQSLAADESGSLEQGEIIAALRL